MIEKTTVKYVVIVYLLLYMKDSYPYKTMTSIKNICCDIEIFSKEKNQYRKNKKISCCIEWLVKYGYLITYNFDNSKPSEPFEYSIVEDSIFAKSKKYILINALDYIKYVHFVSSSDFEKLSIDTITRTYLEIQYLTRVWSHNFGIKEANVWCGNLKSVGTRIGVSHVSVTRAVKFLSENNLLYVMYGIYDKDRKKAETIIVDTTSSTYDFVQNAINKAKEHIMKSSSGVGWYVLK